MKRIRGIAPGTAQITSVSRTKYTAAQPACLPLNGFEYFCDEHGLLLLKLNLANLFFRVVLFANNKSPL